MWRKQFRKSLQSLRLLAAGTAGLAACALLATPEGARAAPISFSLMTASGVAGCGKDCRIVVAADGEIDNSSPARFEALVRNHLGPKPKGLTVLLNSQGGFVIAATNLGQLFRKYRATVVVGRVWRTDLNTMLIRMSAGRCVSACIYALMGGVKRVAPSGSRLVLHRSYSDGSLFRARQYNNEIVQQIILSHAKSMGVSTDVIGYAERLPPSLLYTVTPAQMAQWKLAVPRF